MPVSDPLFHPMLLGRRAALDAPMFEPFPPGGRSPWSRPVVDRRDLDFHVRHYRITREVDFEGRRLEGEAALRIESARDGLRTLVLDAAELDVRSVRRGTRSLRHESGNERISIHLPRPLRRGQTVTVAIRYATRPRKGFHFTGPTEAEPRRGVCGWTQGQADDTHWWVPCLESTESRATHETIVTVPAGFRVIGNGRLVARRSNARRKTATYHWKQETAHPAYLMSLVIGRYREIRGRAGRTALSYYVPRGRERDARRLFQRTPRMIAAFERAFGHPYPYPKYAQSTVWDFTYGGMENTSATTLTERALIGPAEAVDTSYETLISHELAHQWWGDFVTCRDWSEAWLNEGFATYSEIVFWEAEWGKDAADLARLEQMCGYLNEDSSEYRRAIVETRRRYSTELFDRHLYEKGALVLHMLRSVLGEDAWRRSIRRYVTRHALGAVETADLRRACEEESGRNLSWFFDQWLYHGGHPELRVTRRWNERARTLTLVVEQVQAEDGGLTPAFRLPLAVEVLVGTRRVRFPVEIRERKETIHLPLPGRPRYVALDPEHDVMKLLDFRRTDEELRHGLARSPHALERTRCARELGALGGRASTAALFRALRRDRSLAVRVAAAISLGEIGRRTGGLSDRLAAARAGQEARVRRTLAWALGWIGDPPAVRHLRRIVAEEPSAIAAGIALLGIARTGREGAFEILQAELGRESHRDIMRHLLFEGMALLKDPRAVSIFLDFTAPRHKNEAREAAVKALGRLGILNDRVEGRLTELLRDRWFRVRVGAARSLQKLKSPKTSDAIAAALRDEIMDQVRAEFEAVLDEVKAAR
jgi:aminopeptidase N